VRSCADGREDGLVVVVHRHHEDVDLIRFVGDATGRIDAVEAGHVDVHNDDVGHEAQRDLDSLLSRFGL
jgi:hypothetical protein